MKTVQQSATTLGSECLLTIVAASEIDAELILAELWETIFRFNNQFSRFQHNSELTKLNRAGGKKFAVSREMTAILTAAKQMSELTGGLYNPFVLPALLRAGYDRSWIDPNVTTKLPKATRVASPGELIISDGWVQIPSDAAVDLGGIGKGFLLDSLARWLDGKIHGYWISLGGDVIVGGSDADDKPWTVVIDGAGIIGRPVAEVTLSTSLKVVATSGITRRRGESRDEIWHHIIDPKTSKSAQTDILTASIVSASGLEADVLASCAVILGTAEAPQWLAERGITNALIQTAKNVKIIGEEIREI